MKMEKISPQKNTQIKTNLDNATDFLKYKASIISSVMQVQILLLLSLSWLPKANFVLQFFCLQI